MFPCCLITLGLLSSVSRPTFPWLQRALLKGTVFRASDKDFFFLLSFVFYNVFADMTCQLGEEAGFGLVST